MRDEDERAKGMGKGDWGKRVLGRGGDMEGASTDAYSIRLATRADVSALEALVETSVRGLGPSQYSERQIELSLQYLFGIDTRLIDDVTYYVVETQNNDNGLRIVGCGGWSLRKTPFGGDQAEAQDPERRDPATIRQSSGRSSCTPMRLARVSAAVFWTCANG